MSEFGKFSSQYNINNWGINDTEYDNGNNEKPFMDDESDNIYDDGADWTGDIEDFILVFDELNNYSPSEISDMAHEISKYVNKIDPKTLKKVFDGWNDRKESYRKIMREDEATMELDDKECDDWADMFFVGTIFRDYLDSILGLKNKEMSGFVLYDSSEEEIADKGTSVAWYDIYQQTVNVIGDRIENKTSFIVSIAHEMWHAHQRLVMIESDNDRSKLYEECFKNYIDCKEDNEGYNNQLVEVEARAFEYFFLKKMNIAMESSPLMRHELNKPFIDPIEPLNLDLDSFNRLMKKMGVQIPKNMLQSE